MTYVQHKVPFSVPEQGHFIPGYITEGVFSLFVDRSMENAQTCDPLHCSLQTDSLLSALHTVYEHCKAPHVRRKTEEIGDPTKKKKKKTQYTAIG